jgi:putative ABC transport system permease protein
MSSAIAAAETAIALMLLVGAVLMIRTFANLNAINPGFDPHGVLTASIALPNDRYPTEASRNLFFDQLGSAVAGVPGVQGVAYGRNAASGAFSITTAVESEDGAWVTELVGMNDVSSRYFATLRIPFIAGETFRSAPDDTVIVSRSLANRLWPSQSAVGRRLRLGTEGPWWTVVGVVGDVENRMLQLGPVTDQRVAMFLYVPFADRIAVAPRPATTRVFVPRVVMVRAADPAGIVNVLKARVLALDPTQPIENVALADETYANLFDRQRFVFVLMVGFSAAALLLATTGIFAVVSQTVSLRVREIAIRVTLGATPHDIFRMVLLRGVAIAVIGACLGTAAAAALSRLMASLLFGVTPHDWVSYVTVNLLLMAAAILACWLPTRRALRIEPALALKVE